MDVQLIRSFVSVATTGSVSAAARQLGYSQPAVTAHLAALERQVHGPLFVRGRRGMALTDLGLRVLPHAGGLLMELELLLAEEADSSPQWVRIGYWPPPLRPLLDRLVQAARNHLPGLTIRPVLLGRAAEIEHSLLAGLEDLQLVPGPVTDRRLRTISIAPLIVGVRLSSTHPLAALATVRTADILDLRTYALAGVPIAWSAFWTAEVPRGGVAPRIGRDRLTFDDCLEPVGVGAMVLCPPLLARLIPPEDVWRPVEDHPPAAVELAWRADEVRPAVLALARLCRLSDQGGGSTTRSASKAHSSAKG